MTGGCISATLRSDFTQPSGQPLQAVETARQGSYVEEVETGGVKNSDGEVIGTTYQNVERQYTYYTTQITQGGEPIDPESFVRIAQDPEGIALYEEYHKKGLKNLKLGNLAVKIGAVLVAGGITTFVLTNDKDNTKTNVGEISGITVGSLGLGGIVSGFLAASEGKKAAETTAPPMDLVGGCREFFAIARAYNSTLSGRGYAPRPSPAPYPKPPRRNWSRKAPQPRPYAPSPATLSAGRCLQ